jgi:hypothetical protein
MTTSKELADRIEKMPIWSFAILVGMNADAHFSLVCDARKTIVTVLRATPPASAPPEITDVHCGPSDDAEWQAQELANARAAALHWRERAEKAEAKIAAPPNLLEPRQPHKTMTRGEYFSAEIIGWHEVCRDVDGYNGVGVRYLSEADPETKP